MLTQEPLSTHDGRPGNRGSVVNIASQLGVVGRPAARMSLLRPSLPTLSAAAGNRSSGLLHLRGSEC
jgi:hypothetical protein